MAYQHLGLNFPGHGPQAGGAPPTTFSSTGPSARPRLGLRDLLNPAPGSQDAHPSSESSSIASELAQLRADIRSLTDNAPQSMFSDPAEIERARAAASSTQRSRKTLEPIRPGYKSDVLLTVLPPKIEDLFRDYKYCPYPALTPAARKSAFRGEDDYSAIHTGDGGLTIRPKPIPRDKELYITSTDWHAASQLAVDKLRVHWPNDPARAENLGKHNQIVTNLAAQYSHDVAMAYDVHQRELMYGDSRHDVSTLDQVCLQLCIHEVGKRSTSSGQSSGSQVQRKRNTDDQDNSGSDRWKRQRSSSSTTRHCFRCGNAGHFPAECTNDTTTARKPCARLSGNPRFAHGLRAPNNDEYCFRFANSSKCQYGRGCKHYHGCSICHNKGHGAGDCSHAADGSPATGTA
ncbi:hypothetical protein C8R43DRAFT_1004753 [Mycena crocata]|nr:hypothetical protein C8R43DRAFT_1004753 [Mycena crocata]